MVFLLSHYLPQRNKVGVVVSLLFFPRWLIYEKTDIYFDAVGVLLTANSENQIVLYTFE